ncbi:hypothetical protein FRC10_000068 [Ceratobasidium sp. 414]|nr:hypothetical protein FRC10_000068 [Ceratobasidium sp. 414]
MIFKLRRRQSSSLPLRASHPPTYVHHASTPPDWPTAPSQATPDVYITSPAEDDGLQTSVCVHRAIEHEPKKLKKNEEHRMSAPASIDANALEGEQGPPVFRRSSLPAPDVVMPKKVSEAGSTTKWTQILNRQSAADKGAQERAEQDAVVSDVELSTAGQAQWEGGHQLTRVSSSRDVSNEPVPTPAVPKQKHTLRHRASRVFKSLTNRESLAFGSSSADKIENRANGSQQKRRNTLSDGSRPFGIWMRAATAHAIPVTTVDDSVATSSKTSVGHRRRSSTIARVEGITHPTTPSLPLVSVPQEIARKELPTAPAANEAVLPLEPPLEIAEPASKPTSDAPKPGKRKGGFSHLFGLKGSEKQFRSPPPTKQEDAPVPPVPVIPQELAKAVADPDTPDVQTETFGPSDATAATTPKSTKSAKSTKRKKFLRHRRRATIGSISQTPGCIPLSLATPDTPKTPTSLHSRPFSIIDLRKGFTMRSLGKNKGKMMSAKSSPVTPPPVPKLSKEEERELPTTVMQRYKMSRPPPLQPSDSSQQSEPMAVPATASTIVVSPTTVDFNEVAQPADTALSSPTESEGPVTPMFGAEIGSAPALAPAIELGEPKQPEESAPELSFTPPTSEDSEQSAHRPSAASEATLAVDDPLFGMLDGPSSFGDLHLQLHEPSTKTSTLDAHLRLDSLRFDHFAFDADVF